MNGWEQNLDAIHDDVLLAEPAVAYRDHQDAFVDAAIRGLLFDDRWSQVLAILDSAAVDPSRTAELVEIAEREGVMGFAPEDLVEVFSARHHFEAVTDALAEVTVPEQSIEPASGDAITDTNGRWEVVDSSNDTLPPASVPPISQARVIALPRRGLQIWRGAALAAMTLLAVAIGAIIWLLSDQPPTSDREANAHETLVAPKEVSAKSAYEADVRNRCLEDVATHMEAVTVAQPVWNRLNLACARALEIDPSNEALQAAYDETVTAQMWLRYYQTARNHLAAGECAEAELELSSIGADAFLTTEVEKTRKMVEGCLAREARIEALQATDSISNGDDGPVPGAESPLDNQRLAEARELAKKGQALLLSHPKKSADLYKAALRIVENTRWRANYAFALERQGKVCDASRQYKRVLPRLTGGKKKRAQKTIDQYRDKCE